MVAGFHRNVLSIYRGPLLGHCRDREVSTSRDLLSQAGLHGNWFLSNLNIPNNTISADIVKFNLTSNREHRNSTRIRGSNR
jgi:hypothetical protein